jgi:hypothetical protein
MPLIRHRDKIVFFVHIPKTGGTSVEDAMAQAGASVALRAGTRFNGFMKTTFQHLDAQIHTQVIPPDFFDYAFATVRHPVSRLVSEYFYRRRRGFAKMPFDRWVNAVIDGYAKDPYIIDNHLRPQVDFLSDGVEAFRIEDGIDKPLTRAAEVLGITLKDANPHSNRRKKNKPVDWVPITRDRVLDFYAADFARFDYDPLQDFDSVRIGSPDLAGLIWPQSARV